MASRQRKKLEKVETRSDPVMEAAPAPPIILPSMLRMSITYEFAQSRLDCQVTPANCVSYSQLIVILSQLITTFATQNMTAEAEYFKRETARVHAQG